MTDLRIGSLFSGYGGLDMGVTAALGGSVAWHVEYDKAPSKILAHHWPDVPNFGDVTAVDWSQVEPLDVITAGYPCQPFSTSGHRKGANDERHLWPYVHEAVRVLRPRLVVLENVAGHRTMGFDQVLGDLAGIGYDAQWTSLRASEVGAPHHRERLFIVAHPASSGRPEWVSQGFTSTTPAIEQWASDPARDLDSALRRWGRIVGRPNPAPLRTGSYTGNAGNAAFWEWLMGLPLGHVTEVPGLAHWEKLKALGNGVIPQQAAAALRYLLSVQAVAA